jgi:hypothetical protein
VTPAHTSAAILWVLCGCHGAGPAVPYPIADCQASTANYGDWKAPSEVIASAVAGIGKTLCYGYWELEPRRVESSVRACTARVNASTVKFRISEPDGGCEVQVLTAKQGERRWVWVRSMYARGGEVGDQQDIVELRGASVAPYAHYWQCGLSSEDARKPDALGREEGPSAEMRADWPSLPPELRVFLCRGDLKDQP